MVYIRKMLCRRPNDRVKEVSLRLFTDHTRKGGDNENNFRKNKKILDQTHTER